MEGLHEVHIDIAILLHLEEESELGGALLTEWDEERTVSLNSKDIERREISDSTIYM